MDPLAAGDRSSVTSSAAARRATQPGLPRRDTAAGEPTPRPRRVRARFVDRVVGTLWWHERFPDRDLASVPRLRPGQGARQAFFRVEDTGPTITLPRRYRTKGVVLHELTHWALGIDSGLPHHGRTFARVLLDATAEFWGADHAAVLASAYRGATRARRQAASPRARRLPAVRMGRAPPAREGARAHGGVHDPRRRAVDRHRHVRRVRAGLVGRADHVRRRRRDHGSRRARSGTSRDD